MIENKRLGYILMLANNKLTHQNMQCQCKVNLKRHTFSFMFGIILQSVSRKAEFNWTSLYPFIHF